MPNQQDQASSSPENFRERLHFNSVKDQYHEYEEDDDHFSFP